MWVLLLVVVMGAPLFLAIVCPTFVAVALVADATSNLATLEPDDPALGHRRTCHLPPD